MSLSSYQHIVFLVLVAAQCCSAITTPYAETLIRSNPTVPQSFADGAQGQAKFGTLSSASLDGNDIFFLDSEAHTVIKYFAANQSVLTVAGSPGLSGTANGVGRAARFNNPTSVIVVGSFLYVADTANHCVRKVNKATGAVTTLVGTCGSTSGFLLNPSGLVEWSGMLFIADRGHDAIKVVVLQSMFTSTFVQQTNLQPSALTLDSSTLYIASGLGFYKSSLVAGQTSGTATLMVDQVTTMYVAGFAYRDGTRELYYYGSNMEENVYAYNVDTNTITSKAAWDATDGDLDGHPPAFGSFINAFTFRGTTTIVVVESSSLRQLVLDTPPTTTAAPTTTTAAPTTTTAAPTTTTAAPTTTTAAPTTTTAAPTTTPTPTTAAPPVTVMLGLPSGALPLSNSTLMQQLAVLLAADLSESFANFTGNASDFAFVSNSSGLPLTVQSNDLTVTMFTIVAPSSVNATGAVAVVGSAALVRVRAFLASLYADWRVGAPLCTTVCSGSNCSSTSTASPSSVCAMFAVMDPAVEKGAIAAAVVVGTTGLAAATMALFGGPVYMLQAALLFPLL